jgi:uncharacterized membrane protein YfcA
VLDGAERSADATAMTDCELWKLRRSIKLARLLPFLLGAVVGVPIGVKLLHWTSPATLRVSIGIVLILFSLYNLMRPQLGPVRAGKAADGVIGVFNGAQCASSRCDRPREVLEGHWLRRSLAASIS